MNTLRSELIQLFKTNPSLTDDQIHAIATKHGMTPEAFEAQVYQLLHDALNGNVELVVQASTKDKVVARIKERMKHRETAAPFTLHDDK